MKIIILASILLLSLNSFAGLYFEPAITYEKGDNTLDWPSPFSSSTGTTQGLGLDLKLGFAVESTFFAGVDASYSKPKFKNSANNYDAWATSQTIGVIVGAQMPIIGLRIWGGYILDGNLDPDQDGNIDVKFSGASGPKIGIGFKIFIVSANLEYMDLTYKTSTLQNAGPISGALDSELKNKVGLFSLSMPLTF
jgi:hypothetical protein